MDLNWQDAEKTLSEIELTRHAEIFRRKLPLITLFSVVVILGGLYLAVSTVLDTLDGLIITFWNIPFLGNIVYIVLGAMMIMGGVIGMLQLSKGQV
jgi:hypothetical protein